MGAFSNSEKKEKVELNIIIDIVGSLEVRISSREALQKNELIFLD